MYVAYSTLSPSESYPFLPPLDPTMRRADYSEYEYMSGVATFLSGQRHVTINVSVKANLSQPDSVVFVRLNYITLAQAQQPRTGVLSYALKIKGGKLPAIWDHTVLKVNK